MEHMHGLSRCRLYRPAHLTEEPLHTPRLPLRGGAGACIRTHHARPCYLVITPLQEWLAAFVLTMARPEAIDRAASGEVPNQCCERGCRNCPWDYQGGHKNAARRAKKRKSR